MQHRDWRFRILDMIDAIHSILEYTKELDLEQFAADRKTVDAVIRNLIVIGEAAVRVPDEICRENPEIPWFEIRGMRNFVVHEYFRASDKVVWDTVKIDLPPLLKLLEKIS
ncbi:MAG: DUF86 domain-containing protein [Desulfatiglandaceae bacterium]